mmetsp:Transcript_26999/g.108063  ORF Transcript_26999/g.108063 Transcript_26999/m.108063 type:complete len:86 (+) Transcript_26999:402-659(+)
MTTLPSESAGRGGESQPRDDALNNRMDWEEGRCLGERAPPRQLKRDAGALFAHYINSTGGHRRYRMTDSTRTAGLSPVSVQHSTL